MKKTLAAVAAIALLTLGGMAQASAIFDDAYGTNPGRVSGSSRWVPSPIDAASINLVDEPLDCAIVKGGAAAAERQQIILPAANAGGGGPWTMKVVFEFGLLLNPNAFSGQLRMNLVNGNSSPNWPHSRAWGFMIDGSGGLYDLTDSTYLGEVDRATYHVYRLEIADPITGDGMLSIDGGAGQTLSIANESDADPIAWIRWYDSGPGTQTLGWMDKASLALVPEPASLSILAAGCAGLLIRRRPKA